MRPLQFLLRESKRRGLLDHATIPIPPACKADIKWWLSDNRLHQGTCISLPPPSISMETDASKVGWGCRIGSSLSRGTWSQKESLLHINLLEIRAIFQAIKANSILLQGRVVSLFGDNTISLHFIKHLEGTRAVIYYMEVRRVLLLEESLRDRPIPKLSKIPKCSR